MQLHRKKRMLFLLLSLFLFTLLTCNASANELNKILNQEVTNSPKATPTPEPKSYLVIIHTPKPTSTPQCTEAVVEEILGYRDYQTDKAWNLIKEHHQYMTRDQLKECLLSYGQWKALEKADEIIKYSLKSPSSYHRYGGSMKDPFESYTGEHVVQFTIKYGGSNSFGAEVVDEASISIYYEIDLENVSVKLTKALRMDSGMYAEWAL